MTIKITGQIKDVNEPRKNAEPKRIIAIPKYI